MNNNEMLTLLIDKVIKVDSGGASLTGKLLGVKEDYFILLTEKDGVTYIYSHHVKSITENARKAFDFDLEIPEDFEYKKRSTFLKLLGDLRHHWVKLNHHGPEQHEGVIDEVFDEFITLVYNEVIIRVPVFHIKSVNYGVKIEKPELEDEDKKDDQNQKDDKDKDKGNEKQDK